MEELIRKWGYEILMKKRLYCKNTAIVDYVDYVTIGMVKELIDELAIKAHLSLARPFQKLLDESRAEFDLAQMTFWNDLIHANPRQGQLYHPLTIEECTNNKRISDEET